MNLFNSYMITVELMGGLGNQLFQLFALLACSMEHNLSFYIEDKLIEQGSRKRQYTDTLFDALKPFLKPPLQTDIYRESGFPYKSIPAFDNMKLFGYFQSYRYFDAYKNDIFDLIQLNNKKQNINMNIDFEHTISLHFRLGDYMSLQQYHSVLPNEYYLNAIKTIIDDTQLDDWTILYFYEKEDIELVTKKIKILAHAYPNMTFLSIDTCIEDWEQMLVMSMCRHQIIANSTFSWFGAYFNEKSDKLICYPSTWFGPAYAHNDINDLFPSSWIKVFSNESCD